MPRNRDRDLPPALTELFHRYVRARDAGLAVDLDELLREAGDDAAELGAHVERYEVLERAAGLLGRKGRLGTGGRLGRFHVLRLLGSGGLAEVYLADDPQLGRQVALKVLDRKVALDDEARRWVLREARSLARIEHPNVLRVFEVTEVDGALLAVAEHLSGPSLEEVIAEMRRARDGRPSPPLADMEAEERRRTAARLGAELLPFTRRVAVLEALAGALATCHDNGILHRDVKPGNVVFDAHGVPKLLDFGLAHLEDAQEDTSLDITVRMMGTPAYLAPEQVDQGRTGADPRSDQFSLGTLAYELLTLTQPFQRGARSQTLGAISRCRPRPLRAVDPTVPADLERVVLHALQRRPADRYPGVSALADDLRAFAEHRQVSVAEPRLAHLLRLWARRHRRTVAAFTVALALLAGALAASWLVTARRERAVVTDALATIQPSSLSLPGQFLDALDRLLVQRAAAARFDASPLGRALLGAAGPEVDGAIDALSARIAAVLDAELLPDESGSSTAMFEPWSRVIDLEERLHPGGEHLAEYRLKGKVVFPDEEEHGIACELYRWYPASDESRPSLQDVSLFRQVLLTPVIDPGFYHVVAWTRDRARIVFEYQFMRSPGWHEPLRIDVRARDQATFERSLAYERTLLDMRRFSITDETLDEYLERRGRQDYRTRPASDHPLHVTVPAFRLYPRLVTSAEFARYLESNGIEKRHDLNLAEPAKPALVSHAEAAAYCSWVGGRLPSSYELRVHADVTGSDGWAPTDAIGEWIGDTIKDLVPGEVLALRYAEFNLPGSHPLLWFRSHSFDMRTTVGEYDDLESADRVFLGVGFRPAFTNDDRRGLHQAGSIRRD